MRIRASYILALCAAGAISYYMLTGKMVVGGQADANPQTIAARQAESKEQLFAVRTETLDKEPEVLTWSVGEWRYQMGLDIVDVWAVAT